MDDSHVIRKKRWILPTIVMHLIYLTIFLLNFHVVSAYTVLFAILLIIACATIFGKLYGFLSGLTIAIIQIGSLILLQPWNVFLSSIRFSSVIARSELLIPMVLPIIGLLSGLFAENFGKNSNRLEEKAKTLSKDNQILKTRLEGYDNKFQDLSQTKVYQHSWDVWIDRHDLDEHIVGMMLASLSDDAHLESDSNLKLFDLLVRSRPDILAVMNLAGEIKYYNKKLMAIYGYSIKEQIENKNITSLLLPSSMGHASTNIANAVKSELNPAEKYRMKSVDGGFSKLLISPEISLACMGNPLSLVAYIGNQLNNTDYYIQKNASLDIPGLAELDQKNICCLSNDRRILYISGKIVDMLGEKIENMVGEKIDRYINQRQSSHFEEYMKICSAGQRSSLEIEMVAHLREKTVFFIDAFPAIGETGCFLGVTFLVENITNAKKTEEILQHRLFIEKLISSTSTRFISIKAEELESEIVSVLMKIGDLEEAEESFVEIARSRRIKEPVTFNVVHSKTNSKTHYNNIENINKYETIAIPIIIDSELMGSFRFNQEKYRNNWLEADLELIKLIGEIIINALIRKETELSLRLNESRLSTTLHSIGDAVIATDTNGQVILMNRMAEALTGWSVVNALHQPLSTVFKPVPVIRTSENDISYPDDLYPLSETDDSVILESQDGIRYFISVSQTRIEDQLKEVYGDVTVFRDVTKEKQENDEIRYISFHDKLTGLFNRTFFEVELERLNTKRQYPITLILGDCNGLKIANDIFGHLEGDKLLQSIARILKTATRHEDIVARWGGDEFAIIMPKTDEQAATAIRERILKLCSEAESNPIQPSLALGSATNTDGSSDLIELLKLAEDRMYRHKLMEGKSTKNTLLLSIKKMIYEKSYETEEHAGRLTTIAQQIGRAVGLSDFEMEELSLLSSLHDIGKIGIPDNILMKPSQLSDEEWEIMKEHSKKGYNLAKSTPELTSIADSILHHHEHWDGTGYPAGLQGNQIPKLSRILSIIDAYDVITHSRSYKQAQSSQDALVEIEKCAGSQFDPELTNVFIDIMRENEPKQT